MYAKYEQDNFSSYDMAHWYVWDNSHGQTIYVNSMVKCVHYMDLRSNDSFMAGAALTGGHYMTNIISGVGETRSNSVVPPVFCTVAYRTISRASVLYYRSLETLPTLLGMGNISGRPCTVEL